MMGLSCYEMGIKGVVSSFLAFVTKGLVAVTILLLGIPILLYAETE